MSPAHHKTPRSVVDSLRSRRFVVALPYAALFGLAFYLLFCNLDGRLLWGDEAETALLAKNVLRFGIPKTVDGVNHITELGNFRDENTGHIWTWTPWLQEYVTAASYLVLGETTWSSRAPFAAIAWLSIVLLALVVYRIYRDHRIAFASSVLLVTCEVFLLHARQCRYYAITVLAEVILIHGGSQLLSGRKSGTWLLALGLILQFYTNYIVAVANMPLLIVLGWLVHKERPKLARLLIAFGIFAAASAPWVIYARPWRQLAVLVHENLGSKFLYYVTEWHFHFVPWIFLLLPGIGLLAKFFGSKSQATSKRVTQFEYSLLVGLGGIRDPSRAANGTALFGAASAGRLPSLCCLDIPLHPLANRSCIRNCSSGDQQSLRGRNDFRSSAATSLARSSNGIHRESSRPLQKSFYRRARCFF